MSKTNEPDSFLRVTLLAASLLFVTPAGAEDIKAEGRIIGPYVQIGTITSWLCDGTPSPGVIDIIQYFGLKGDVARGTGISGFTIAFNSKQVWIEYIDMHGGLVASSGRFERMPNPEVGQNEISWVGVRNGFGEDGYYKERCTYTAQATANNELLLHTKWLLSQRHLLGLWQEERSGESLVLFARR